MISDKRVTKNKNILLDVEDLTGKIRVFSSGKMVFGKVLYRRRQEPKILQSPTAIGFLII